MYERRTDDLRGSRAQIVAADGLPQLGRERQATAAAQQQEGAGKVKDPQQVA